MDSSKRWSFKLPDRDAALPAGPFECFEQAIGGLAPISTMHQELDSARWRWCLCVRCASDEVQRLAIEYNQNRLLAQNAPRTKTVIDCANEIERLADQLRCAILKMDDYSRKAFLDYGGYAATRDLPAYAGYLNDFPRDEDEDGIEFDEGPVAESLRDLRDGARRVSAAFRKSRGVGRHEPADKGGNTNLFKEGFGSPDRNLVIGGWKIYERFKPKQAKGTENGDFHEFLKNVFEYATGLDPEDHSSLASWLKALASLLRQRDELLETYIAAESDLRYLEMVSDVSRIGKERFIRVMASATDQLESINSALAEVKLGKKATRIY
jgi:hypothetical protein